MIGTRRGKERGAEPAPAKRGLMRVVRRAFGLRVGVQDRLTNRVLRRRVHDGTQQRERTSLAVDLILPRRERDVATAAAATLPYREANQLQAGEHAVREVQFRIGELSGRVAS